MYDAGSNSIPNGNRIISMLTYNGADGTLTGQFNSDNSATTVTKDLYYGGTAGSGNALPQNSTTLPTSGYPYYYFAQHNGSANSDNRWQFWYKEGSISASATGTAIQAANTVGSAKTEVSGTMIYKDSSGTATLGTDLKIYFTCNGGTNWTEAASYNAITPVYATGIKQVRLGKTTCTSGTDIRYKAVWANQASGSKETQLHGIGINY